MDNQERDQLIIKMIGEGHSLSEIQKTLETEHGCRVSYMDLRMIAADLEVNWTKLDAKAPPKTPDLKAAVDEARKPASRCKVSVSKVVRPGAIFSGSVVFPSGAKGEWYVDQYGRLGLAPAADSKKPTEEDMREFQAELQRSLQGKM